MFDHRFRGGATIRTSAKDVSDIQKLFAQRGQSARAAMTSDDSIDVQVWTEHGGERWTVRRVQ
jgi:hypothetical protein